MTPVSEVFQLVKIASFMGIVLSIAESEVANSE